MPKVIVVQPITSKVCKTLMTFVFVKKKPTIIIGNDDVKTNKKIFLFLTKLIRSFLKNTNTAKNEPICKLMFVNRFS